ncbi:MAG: hypothetical protein JMHAAFGB_00274 [Dehalococcoides mccartyi]|nr:hypothetical protein [Dehalococcoides mccartyi]
MVILGGCQIYFIQTLTLVSDLRVYLAGQAYARFFSQQFQCPFKIQPFFFHYESENIPAGIAGSETVPVLGFGVNEERAVFFAVKRADSAHSAACFGQFGILADKAHNIQFLLYFFYSVIHIIQPD